MSRGKLTGTFPSCLSSLVIHAALCEENLYGAADQAMQIEQTGSLALCQSLGHIHSYFSIKISTSWLIWRPLIFFLITFGDWVVTHIQTWRVALMMTWTCSLSRMQGYYLSKITFLLGKILLWTYVVLVQIKFLSFLYGTLMVKFLGSNRGKWFKTESKGVHWGGIKVPPPSNSGSAH